VRIQGRCSEESTDGTLDARQLAGAIAGVEIDGDAMRRRRVNGRVGAGTGVIDVVTVARTADNRVVAATGVGKVVAAAGLDFVIPAPGCDVIIAGAREDVIVAIAGGDVIIAVAGLDLDRHVGRKVEIEILLRAGEIDDDRIPTRRLWSSMARIQTPPVRDNNTTYAYAIDQTGHLRTDDPFIGGSPTATRRFIVANSNRLPGAGTLDRDILTADRHLLAESARRDEDDVTRRAVLSSNPATPTRLPRRLCGCPPTPNASQPWARTPARCSRPVSRAGKRSIDGADCWTASSECRPRRAWEWRPQIPIKRGAYIASKEKSPA